MQRRTAYAESRNYWPNYLKNNLRGLNDKIYTFSSLKHTSTRNLHLQIAIHLYGAGRLDCLLLRGRRRRSNDGCASAGEARLAVEGRGDEAAHGGASHGPKLPAATAPGPCFLDDAEASAALAPSHAELAPTARGAAPGGARSRGCPRSRGWQSPRLPLRQRPPSRWLC